MFQDEERLEIVDISKTMRESFLDYSMSVIVQRALPDVRDGLKPVHRRILYAMNDLGIVAGKLVEKYHRPAIVLAETDGVFKGSGRSFGEFNLAEALAVCKDYIVAGGGHAEACGLKVAPDRIDDFRRAINAYYEGLQLKNQERFLGIKEDLQVRDFDQFSLELVTELQKLEPYGMGNEEPIFLLPEVRVVEAAKLGADGKHLRLTVWDQNGKSLKLIQFYAPEEYLQLRGGEIINAWITLGENEYRGLRSVEGRIVKLAIA